MFLVQRSEDNPWRKRDYILPEYNVRKCIPMDERENVNTSIFNKVNDPFRCTVHLKNFQIAINKSGEGYYTIFSFICCGGWRTY